MVYSQKRMGALKARLAGAAVLVLVIAMALASPAGAQARPAYAAHVAGHGKGKQAPLGGIDINGVGNDASISRIDAEVAAAQSLKAKLVRIELPWSQFEPQAQGRLDPATVAMTDRLMQDASKAHLKVIALVDSTPCWASTAPASLLAACAPEAPGHSAAWPPKSAASYGKFVGWLARRYGKELAAIEVWNEPDQANQDYLTGPSKPKHYAELLRAAYPAIKHADAQVKVIAGSLVGSNGAFMNALYKEGVKGYYDGVAVHFYTLTLGSLRVFHENQLAHGDHKPLWLDEYGWSSCWPKYKIEQEQGCVTPAVQAQNLANMIRQLARTSWVAANTSYNLQGSVQEEFGVLSPEGKRKPSFYALSKAFASPFASPSPVTLKLHAKNGQVLASGSAPVGDYLKLEAFQGGRLRYRVIFSLDRFNDYTIKLPKVLGTHGLTVRVYQYWLGRGRDAQRSI